MDCIFCRILKGEIPALKLAETEDTLAFMDINPVSPGHCLVIPKNHHVNVLDCPPTLFSKVMAEAQKLAVQVKENLGCDGINLVSASGKAAQQSVFHLHFHIIPRWAGDGIDLWFHGKPSQTTPSEMQEMILGK